MDFPSHAHQYSDVDSDGTDECHDMQSHSLDPDQTHSVTVNGDPVFLDGDSTADPGSGGTASITGAGQSSVSL